MSEEDEPGFLYHFDALEDPRINMSIRRLQKKEGWGDSTLDMKLLAIKLLSHCES